MKKEKKCKWNIGTVILNGKQSYTLMKTYYKDLEHRLKPEEPEQHEANVAELERRRSGQPVSLVDQKSKTLGQNFAIKMVFTYVSSILRIVKSNNPTPEIAKAYGVGEKKVTTVNGARAFGKMVLAGYNKYKAWSKTAGIVESDMEMLSKLIETLGQVDEEQELSKFQKKSRTMDKNTLQRKVEDEITRLSALGIREFKEKDPSVAALFAGLIPSSKKTRKPVVDVG